MRNILARETIVFYLHLETVQLAGLQRLRLMSGLTNCAPYIVFSALLHTADPVVYAPISDRMNTLIVLLDEPHMRFLFDFLNIADKC